MITFFGESSNYLLFIDDANGVVIDKTMNMVEEIGPAPVVASMRPWLRDTDKPEQALFDLASGALADLRVQTLTASGRLYTIPKAAQEEAIKALAWRKEHGRGGTPVGTHTARILANGGQIGLRKVRHIAKYFPRHEVDKKAKGYKPGEDGFPSNGRIAWALWGGDSAWRWARAIVDSENKKAINAAGDYHDIEDYTLATEYTADVDYFKAAHALPDTDEDAGPQFVGRTLLDGSGIDRLYVIDQEGNARVWDEGAWDDLGQPNSDISVYDKLLDGDHVDSNKQHVFIDPASAFIVSARLQQNPYKPVSVYDLDADEAALVDAAMSEIDWYEVDSAITAAGEDIAVSDGDGKYTPEERSAKARQQVRDQTGRFSAMGSRVVIGGNATNSGTITKINPLKQSVSVKLDSGSVVEVPANQTQTAEDFAGSTDPGAIQQTTPLDTGGILGQPRIPIDTPNATMAGTLPPLTQDQLQSVLYNYPAWVKEQRDKAAASATAPAGPDPVDLKKMRSDYNKQREKETGVSYKGLGDLREHPIFKELFKKKPSYNLYYNPMVSSGEQPDVIEIADDKKTIKELVDETPQGTGEPVDPTTSDVQPIYLAIVSPEDPRAVFDLISIVPAGTNSTSPVAYKREDKKWVKDDQTMSDLSSVTPPPVIPLHGEMLKSVFEQIDGVVTASGISEFAQGGLDKNRGNAEKLRHYWVYGRGAAKIRWGAPGDWSRCVRHLAKFMGPRAKGYCNLRHKDALHIYPATHAKLLHGGKRHAVDEFIMEQPVYEVYGGKKGKPKTNITAEDLEAAELIDHEDVVSFGFTKVTDQDMQKELDQIIAESGDDEDSWEPDDDIIVLMTDKELCEHSLSPITAEGGLDRNRGNAEKLRRYWLYGRGAAKIRWNTPGDWTRCYRHLMKYMGPRAKGYCQLRHKEATGVWTGSRFNIGKRNIRGSAELFGNHEIATEEQFIDALVLRAKMNDARNRVLTAGANTEGTGCRFRIPIVIPEGAESGDGRMFKKEAIEIRELPLPLLWQIKTGDGHMGSVVVGRIDHMERTPDGIGNAHGVFDTGVYGREAERLVRNGFLRGVSADLDQFEAVGEADNEAGADEEEKKIGGDKIKITHARVMAVTIVPKPAFEQCTIAIEDDGAQMFQEDTMEIIPDGVYIEDLDELDAQAIVACGILAGAIPAVPPAHWFGNPNLSGPTPLTVDDAGRVFGHIAAWSVSHIGMAPGTRPPKSKSKYAYFHTGLVRTDDGKDVPVGQLTLAGGHASLEASAMDAARHYDDTGSAIADVHAGEDSHGIWVAGALRPSASPEQIRALRASAPSGDWRPISGSLELVAVCQVNVPGFPIARARVASGQVYALVAAGASTLARMKSDPLGELSGRIAALENKEKEELIAKAEELSARFRSELSYDPTSFGFMSKNVRQKLASEGKALPDGSFPIRTVDDLKNAIQSYGRAKEGKRAVVRRHIMKRARGLDRADMIPEAWKSASALEEDAAELRARVASAQSIAEYAQISPKVRQRLASEGKALPDGSFPIRNMTDLSNAIRAYELSDHEDRSKVKNHIMKRAHALGNAEAIPAEWKSASAVEQDVATLRARIASASSSITNEEDSE